MIDSETLKKWLIENCTLEEGIGGGVIHLSNLDLHDWDLVIDNLKCDMLCIDDCIIEDELSLYNVKCKRFEAQDCKSNVGINYE